jgi:murein DD-endopeptidase MepM/ murein hydrolase activator NlpD
MKPRLNDFMFKRNKIVSPAQAGIQINPKKLDSCFYRNDKLSFLYWGSIFFGFIFILFYPFTSTRSQVDPASEWNLLYPKIRDRTISKGEAQEKLKALEILLKDFYLRTTSLEQDDRLCFPLKGYGPSAIGGKGGSGYQIQGYDFFDGNQHKGHPSHDIFIFDQNQDGLDDRTRKPVEVIAAVSGVVVSVNLHWDPPSLIRGGNYIWTYDPMKSRYYYYAHLNEIFVKAGQVVSKGERLGTVGRTGVKAYPKKSPTHLHFTVHQSKDGYPKPFNPFMELIKASCQERSSSF